MIPLWFSINWNVLDLTCWAIAWSSLFLERNMDITHPNVKYLHKMTFMPVSNMLTKLTSSWIPPIANHEQKQLKTEKINLVSFDINFYACMSVMSCDPIWNKGFWYFLFFVVDAWPLASTATNCSGYFVATVFCPDFCCCWYFWIFLEAYFSSSLCVLTVTLFCLLCAWWKASYYYASGSLSA